MSPSDYTKAHRSTVILCHDVFIEYQGGILLIYRKNYPAKDILWPLGGRVERGVPVEDSLKKKVKRESNLDLAGLRIVGFSRTFFLTDPFGHNHGTDTFNIVYFGKGVGILELDADHEKPTIIQPHQMQQAKETLHPYVSHFLGKLDRSVSSSG